MITIQQPTNQLRVHDLIDAAFRLLRGAKSPEAIDAMDRENGLLALRGMAATWQAEGVGLWTDEEVEFTLCCQAEFRIDRFLHVRNVRRRDANGYDVPLGNQGQPLSRADYLLIPSKAATGVPVQSYYWMAPTHGVLTVWPVPSSTDYTVVFTGRRPFRDFTLDAVIDFPPEWWDALRYNLAVSLAAEYPDNKLSPLALSKAAELKQALTDTDYDRGSTFFQPDVW